MDKVVLWLGLAAAGLTTFSFLPQAIKTIRTKHTKDLSLPMLIMLVAGVALWMIYGFIISDVPLILANTISLVLMITILILKVKYG